MISDKAIRYDTLCAKVTVTKVAHAGQNVPIGIKLRINSCGDNFYFWKSIGNIVNTY